MLDRYLPNYFFSVTIEGLSANHDSTFQDVSGLSKEIKINELTSDGGNRFKCHLPVKKGSVFLKYQALVFVFKVVHWY